MDVQTQRALVHPKRTEILGYLMQKRGEEGAGEGELADSLELAATLVKYHLTVLCDADLVTGDLESGATGRYVAAASAGA